MAWFFAVLVVLALGAVAMVAAGHGTPMAPEHADRADPMPPPGRDLTGVDLRTVTFDTAVRGYRADQVDALLSRLATQLEASAAGPTDGGAPPTPGAEVDGGGEDR